MQKKNKATRTMNDQWTENTTLIGPLYDDVILLQLAESLSLLFSCAN